MGWFSSVARSFFDGGPTLFGYKINFHPTDSYFALMSMSGVSTECAEIVQYTPPLIGLLRIFINHTKRKGINGGRGMDDSAL